MKIFSLAVALSFSLSSYASDLSTRIIEVVPTKAGNEAMVFAEDEGRVIWIDSRDTALVEALEIARKNNNQLRLDYDEETGNLVGVELLEVLAAVSSATAASQEQKYTPSVLPSVDYAQEVFNAQDRATKWRSQCYNRAHGWAFDMWRKYKVNSMKMFLFFTRRFIEEYKYKWWFHVAPYVMVETENGPTEMIMDVSFMKGPTELKKWTDYFLRATKPVCPEVKKYSDYRNNQMVQDCYVMKTSMYYRSPMDLELLEKQGRQELDWNLNEVREARKQAFKNWRDYDI
jgi:hypothetical protein